MSESPPTSFEKLRELLVGPERDRIGRAEERLESVRAAWDRDLPPALARMARDEAEFDGWLGQSFERLLAHSLRKDPGGFGRALAPAIIPAVRSAVLDELRTRLAAIEAILERAVTLEAIRWRIQSWRSGQPVAVIAMKSGVLASIEELMVVHDESGLHLASAALAERAAPDADVTSGILSAIRAFVRDAYAAGPTDELQRISFGEHELWLTRGGATTLAATIRGVGEAGLGARLSAALLEVEAALDPEQAPGALLPAQTLTLTSILERHLRPAAPRPTRGWGKWILAGVAAAALVAAFSWLVPRIQARWRASAWVAEISERSDLEVIGTRFEGGRLSIEGLIEPGAPVPEPPEGLAVEELRWWASTRLEPEQIVERARQMLRPPSTVSLELRIGHVLVAHGEAPHAWIERFEGFGGFVPGVSSLDVEGLRDGDRALAERLAEEPPEELAFARGSARVSFDPEPYVEWVRALDAALDAAGLRATVEVVGEATLKGGRDRNERLSAARAAVLSELLEPLPLRHVTLRTVFETEGARRAWLRVGALEVQP